MTKSASLAIRNYPKRAVFNKILSGAIGDIRTITLPLQHWTCLEEETSRGLSDWVRFNLVTGLAIILVL